MRVQIELERETDGRWIADVRSFGILLYGETRADAIKRAKVMTLEVLADRIEHHEEVPPKAVTFDPPGRGGVVSVLIDAPQRVERGGWGVWLTGPRRSIIAKTRTEAVWKARAAVLDKLAYAVKRGHLEAPRTITFPSVTEKPRGTVLRFRSVRSRRRLRGEVPDPETLRILREREHGPSVLWKDVEERFLPKRRRAKPTRRQRSSTRR